LANRVHPAVIGSQVRPFLVGGAQVWILFALLLGASRLVGFVREAVIAYLFGATRATDSYVAATALPELLAGMLLGGLLGYAVIPAIVKLESADDLAGAARLLGASVVQVFLWSAVAAFIGMAFAGPLIHLISPGLQGRDRAQAELMLRITSPAVIFFAFGGLATAILNTRGRFLPSPIGMLAGNLAGIVVLLTSARLGIAVAAYGYLATAIVTAIVPWATVFSRLSLTIRPTLWSPEARAVMAMGGVAALVTGAPYVRHLIERGMASTLRPGDLASLGFATRVVLFVAAAIAVPIGTVVFPKLAAHVVDTNPGEFGRIIRNSLVSSLLIAFAATMVLVPFSSEIVRLLFQHGAFQASGTLVTSAILRFYALGLIAMVANEILIRALFVMGRWLEVLAVLAFSLSVNVGVNIWLIRTLGVQGLALGASLGLSLSCLLLAALLKRAYADWMNRKEVLLG